MDHKSTKDRIISAAVDLFAAAGYAETTVALICEKANVNIAAVNYHFGSKELLFQETIRHAFQVAAASYPLCPPEAITPEEQLRAFISGIIRRSFDDGPAGRIDQMLSHEVVRENSPHHLIVKEIQAYQGEALRGILRKLLRTRSEKLLNQAHVNIAALCFFPKLALPLRKLLFPKPPTVAQLQLYIDGQVDFALAGLAALKPSLSRSL